MNKKLRAIKIRGGFTGIEILIFIAIVSVGFGGIAWIFKDAIKDQNAPAEETKPEEIKSEEVKPVVNPFPAKPSEKLVELPKETSVTVDRGELGAPIVQPAPKPDATATGEWHGQFAITAPAECAGEAGGWQATLTEIDGAIRGNFTADGGFAGSVGGSSSGDNVSWGVGGGGAGVNFKGAISGNTMSGTFAGLVCNKNPAKERSTGTYFGGRKVQ